MNFVRKIAKIREMTSLLAIIILFLGVGAINPAFLQPQISCCLSMAAWSLPCWPSG